MTLKELGQQYLDTAAAIRKRAKELNSNADSLSIGERIVLKRRIAQLCYDINECRANAKTLINYNRKGANK